MSKLEPTNEARADQACLKSAEQGGGTTKVEQLIQQYCPDGVEYHYLNEVASIKRGERVTKAQLIADGQYPVISGGVKPLGYLDRYNREANTITIAQYGTAGYVDWQNSQFWANDVCYSVFPSIIINNRFLYYVLLQKQDLLYSLKTNAIPACLPLDKLTSIEIPVPPLPVQEEIVRILDTFTELQAELQAELQKRLQQYNYYRDNLLSFEGSTDVEWKKLGDITRTYKGAYITQKASKAGSIPVVLGGQEPAYYIDTANHIGEIVAVSRSGASAGFVSYWNEPIYITDGFGFEADTETLTYKYLYYALKRIEPSLQQMKRGGGVPHVSLKELVLVEIPVPSLAEQQRIVDILDRFDSLTHDLTAGLPAEIEKRKQQYEYYRDKLLTFKRINA